MKRCIWFFPVLLWFCFSINAQHLQPGFSKQEYINLMKVSSQLGDSAYAAATPVPAGYKMVYQSPVVGLDNKWQLWTTPDAIPVISIRGTTANEISWLANFYAAMIPAKGELQLSNSEKFHYELSDNPRAAVHVGWMISTAFLVKDILPEIDSCYKKGMKEMLIIGHSQGGAIAFLLTAYLHHLQKQSLLPPDIRFKTYCSAAPKPGNIYFAYEYEAMTQGGWAYNVVNSADWVPQTPLSVQTLDDFNTINPFVFAKSFIKKQSFFKRLALNYGYGRLTTPADKTAKNYEKFLGKYVARLVAKHLKGFKEPAYFASSYYERTGNTITLLADADYYKLYPQEKEKIFVNHFHQPYLYLANKLSLNGAGAIEMNTTSGINGTWALAYISGQTIAFESLYPDKKPFVTIDDATKKVSGTTSCNSFNGQVFIAGNTIHFSDAIAMTKMFCPGGGEHAFFEVLKKISRYAINDSTLTLLSDDIALMRFTRK